jgi:hypothetical protein
MGKRGVALIMVTLIVAVVAVLSAATFSSLMNENRLVRRYVESTRALWLAETGIAEAVDNMPNSVSGSLGGANYTYAANSVLLGGLYYQISSAGTATLPGFGTVSRQLVAVVRTNPVNPNNFQHAIRTTGALKVLGSVDINGPQEEHASLNFANLFQHTKQEMKSYADQVYTNPPNNVTPVNGITWVDLTGSPAPEFQVTSDGWSGSGILVVAGDAQITGGTFNGILYVIGKLRMSGNPVINGTVLAESQATLETRLTGNVTINYDPAQIAAALGPLTFVSPVIVSWREN